MGDLAGNFDLSNRIVVVREICTPDPVIPSISINDVIVNEADGQAELTVSLDQPTTVDVTVSYATSDNTAGASVDFATDSGLITIPAGQTSTTILFDILEDTQDEVDELFDVNLSNPQGATCLLYTSPSPRDATLSRMPSSA